MLKTTHEILQDNAIKELEGILCKVEKDLTARIVVASREFGYHQYLVDNLHVVEYGEPGDFENSQSIILDHTRKAAEFEAVSEALIDFWTGNFTADNWTFSNVITDSNIVGQEKAEAELKKMSSSGSDIEKKMVG